MYAAMVSMSLASAVYAQSAVQGSAVPDDAVPASEETAVSCKQKEENGKHCGHGAFKFDVLAGVDVFKFKNGSITQLDTHFVFDLNKNWKLDVSLPFYSDSIQPKAELGIGDLGADVTYNLFEGKFDGLKTENAWINASGGIGVPMDGEYSSNDITLSLGGEVGASWGDLTLSYNADYTFVDEYTYVAPLGGFVFADIYTGTASASWNLDKNMAFSVNLTQYNASDYDLLTFGPEIEYAFSKSCGVNVGVDFPIDQDIPNGNEFDVTLSAGLSFKF